MAADNTKVFIFTSESKAAYDLFLNVTNYDDHFPKVCRTAMTAWQDTAQDFKKFMLTHLRLAGYKVTASDNYYQ